MKRTFLFSLILFLAINTSAQQQGLGDIDSIPKRNLFDLNTSQEDVVFSVRNRALSSHITDFNVSTSYGQSNIKSLKKQVEECLGEKLYIINEYDTNGWLVKVSKEHCNKDTITTIIQTHTYEKLENTYKVSTFINNSDIDTTRQYREHYFNTKTGYCDSSYIAYSYGWRNLKYYYNDSNLITSTWFWFINKYDINSKYSYKTETLDNDTILISSYKFDLFSKSKDSILMNQFIYTSDGTLCYVCDFDKYRYTPGKEIPEKDPHSICKNTPIIRPTLLSEVMKDVTIEYYE